MRMVFSIHLNFIEFLLLVIEDIIWGIEYKNNESTFVFALYINYLSLIIWWTDSGYNLDHPVDIKICKELMLGGSMLLFVLFL